MGAVYEGMPPTDRTFEVEEWGEIRCGGVCKDDYARLVIYHQTPDRYVKLQAAAMRSFKAAEKAVGSPILLTGAWRSCELQMQLYNSDRARFAPPATTAHCRGLAIDVSQNQPKSKLKKIHKALLFRDWYQARDDEIWHWSFGLKT